MKQLKPLTESKRYVAFTKGRDAGLEHMLGNYSQEMTAIMDTLRRRTAEIASHMLISNQHNAMMKRNRDAFESQLKQLFKMAEERTIGLMRSLRRSTYVLSSVGQAIAISRSLMKPPKLSVNATHIAKHKAKDLNAGGSLDARVDLAYSRLLRKVLDAYQMSQTIGENPQQTIERILKAFPKPVAVPKKKKVMARMTEAGRVGIKLDDPAYTFSGDFFEPDEWDEAVEDYLADYVPPGRGPYDSVFVADEQGEQQLKYRWQIEQELTDDFIDSVRNGENEAANQQGITDFVWIAIIDAKTDDCCSVRDGLTTTEIEEQMDQGKIDTDLCDASSAPAHANCRCRMAPMTDDMPEETPPDFGSFDDWLNNQK